MKKISKLIISFMLCLGMISCTTGLSCTNIVKASNISVGISSQSRTSLKIIAAPASSIGEAKSAVYDKYGAGSDFELLKYKNYYWYYQSYKTEGNGNVYILTYSKGSHVTPWDLL